MNIKITKATSDVEIQGIVELQKINLKKNLSPEEREQFGFVTLEYDFDFVKEMSAAHHHIIAKEGDNVVGYCLLMDRSKNHLMKEGAGIFPIFHELNYKGQRLGDINYVSVGQVCVHRDFSGQGILGKMYAAYKEAYQDFYDLAMTDVYFNNKRSIVGHQKAGFEIIHRFDEPDAGEPWDILVWDWRK